jgi:rhomboid protease GluP
MPRQKSGSILCPSCGQLISVNAETCIHCGQRRPGLWGFGPMLRNLFGHYGFTEVFLTFCILLYGITLVLDPKAIFQMRGFFSFLSPSIQSLDAMGMTGAYAMQQGRWWTPITAIFLHGGLLHIYFNLSSIRQLAPAVEEFFGTTRLILIFMISGILGFVVSNWWGYPYTVGASGSLFGLLGALVFYGRDRGGAFGTAIFKQSWQGALANLLLGFFIPIINNAAHIGGFIGGYLAAMLLGYTEKRRENMTMQISAFSVIGLTAIAFGIVVWRILF